MTCHLKHALNQVWTHWEMWQTWASFPSTFSHRYHLDVETFVGHLEQYSRFQCHIPDIRNECILRPSMFCFTGRHYLAQFLLNCNWPGAGICRILTGAGHPEFILQILLLHLSPTSSGPISAAPSMIFSKSPLSFLSYFVSWPPGDTVLEMAAALQILAVRPLLGKWLSTVADKYTHAGYFVPNATSTAGITLQLLK